MAQGDDRATFTVERERVIAAPPERIHPALVDLREWVHWSPWEGMDPDLERTYSGADAGVGAVYEWRGNRKVGAGRMEITEVDAPNSIAIDLQFLRPFKAHNTTRFDLHREGEGTRVVWSMVGPKTLMSRIMGVFMNMDRMIGKDFEKGLAQLDAHVTA